jgi:hypothetical protein
MTGLLNALYKDPSKIPEALQYMQEAAKISKGTLRTLYKGTQATREKVDAALEQRELPAKDRIDYLDGLLEVSEVARMAIQKYKDGGISPEQLRSYIAKEIEEQRTSFKRHYALRHAGMA